MIKVNEGGALESIIPFDAPKHPRLPYNRFPKSGKAGLVTTAGRVVWISGKYLYKYHKKGLAAALFAGGATSILTSQPKSKRGQNTFNQTYNRFRGSSSRSRQFGKSNCKRCCSTRHNICACRCRNRRKR